MLQTVFDLLNQWYLRQGTWLITVFPPNDLEFPPHPVAGGLPSVGLVEIWSQEVGRL